MCFLLSPNLLSVLLVVLLSRFRLKNTVASWSSSLYFLFFLPPWRASVRLVYKSDIVALSCISVLLLLLSLSLSLSLSFCPLLALSRGHTQTHTQTPRHVHLTRPDMCAVRMARQRVWGQGPRRRRGGQEYTEIRVKINTIDRENVMIGTLATQPSPALFYDKTCWNSQRGDDMWCEKRRGAHNDRYLVSES